MHWLRHDRPGGGGEEEAGGGRGQEGWWGAVGMRGGERKMRVSGEEGSGVSGGGSGIFSTINRVASDNPNRRLCSPKKAL